MLFSMTVLPWSCYISWWPCHEYTMASTNHHDHIMSCQSMIVMFDHSCQPGRTVRSPCRPYCPEYLLQFFIIGTIIFVSKKFCLTVPKKSQMDSGTMFSEWTKVGNDHLLIRKIYQIYCSAGTIQKTHENKNFTFFAELLMIHLMQRSYILNIFPYLK